GFAPRSAPQHDLHTGGPDGRNIFLPAGYDRGMTVRKLSISLPAEGEEKIKARAPQKGKPGSAWAAPAPTQKTPPPAPPPPPPAAEPGAGRPAARDLVAEYEPEPGPLPEAPRQPARQFLLDTGLIDDQPHRAAG